MAMALVWAPRNDLVVGYWLPPFRIATFDMSIVAFSLLAVAVQSGLAVSVGFAWSAAVLHLFGAALGFVLGVVMLKRGWVDCEGWDLYSVLCGPPASASHSDQYTPIKERPLVERPKNDAARLPKQSDPDRGAVLKKVKTIKRLRALLEQHHAVLVLHRQIVQRRHARARHVLTQRDTDTVAARCIGLKIAAYHRVPLLIGADRLEMQGQIDLPMLDP